MEGKIVCVDGLLKGTEFPLTGTKFTIGRDRKNQVVIEDFYVSSEHAVIDLLDRQWRLRDASKNGTRVNGKSIKEHILADGDRIEIHPCTFTFSCKREPEIELSTAVFTAAGNSDPAVSPAEETVPEEPDVLPKPPEAAGTVDKEEIPKARMIVYGIGGLGLLAMLGFSMLGGKTEKTVKDGFVPLKTRKMVSKAPEKKVEADVEKHINFKSRASEAFKIARNLWNDKTKEQNTFHAVLKWEEGFSLLEQGNISADDFKEDALMLTKIKEMLENIVATLQSEVTVLVKQKNYKDAVQVLEQITLFIPDQSDLRHQHAARAILKYGKM